MYIFVGRGILCRTTKKQRFSNKFFIGRKKHVIERLGIFLALDKFDKIEFPTSFTI